MCIRDRPRTEAFPTAARPAPRLLILNKCDLGIHPDWEAVPGIDVYKRQTRQYAKRQRTWLKRAQWLRELPAAPSASPRELAKCIIRELEH